MTKKQPSIPILELSTYEPETKQEHACSPASQSRDERTTSTLGIPATLRVFLSQFVSKSNRNAVASILTLVGMSGFLMFSFGPTSSVKEVDISALSVKNETDAQETASGVLSDLIQKHLKEKNALLAKQDETIQQIKAESEKRIARERAEIATEQERQAEIARKEMETKLANQRAKMLLEKKRFAEQLEEEMRSKLVAQQEQNEINKNRPEDPSNHAAIASEKGPENIDPTQAIIAQPKSEKLYPTESPAELERQEYAQRIADQEAESAAKQKAINEQEQRAIRERLEKQQTIFLAELNKLAKQQKEEIASIKKQTNVSSTNSDAQIATVQNLNEDPTVSELFVRIEKGNITYLQKFLKQGGDPNQSNHLGQSLLIKAASHDQYIMATELLRAGANVDLPDTLGMSPLIYGSTSGNTGIVELLVSNGANVNYLSPKSESALIYASKNGHFEIVDLLIKAGANVNAKDHEGRTALYFATKNNDNATTSLLLENGAAQTQLKIEGVKLQNNSVANNLAFN